VLDIDYRHTAEKYGISISRTMDHDLASFPVEEARLRSLRYSLLLCVFLISGYGWLLQFHVHISMPLILQFFIGLSMQGVFTALSTLLVDIHPNSPSTAQAASNFIRCEVAAGGLAVLDLLLQKLGPGWTFVLFATTGLLSIPCLYILLRQGLSWRQKRSASN